MCQFSLLVHLNNLSTNYWCFQVKCIDFSAAILYILLISAFFGWGLFHRTRERRRAESSNEPLLNVIHDDLIDFVNLQKDESVVTKVNLDFSLRDPIVKQRNVFNSGTEVHQPWIKLQKKKITKKTTMSYPNILQTVAITNIWNW